MKVDNHLSTYEICILTIILLGMKLTDTTPALLSQNTQNAFWYVPLISFFVILPSVLIAYYLMSKHNATNLVDLFEILLGKYLGKLLAFIIFLFSFVLTAFDYRSYVNQIKLLYFERSSLLIIFILLIFISIFGAIRGIKTLGYTARVFFPFLQTTLSILAILILPSIVVERIYPIFGTGLSNVLYDGVSKSSLFSGFFLLMMLYPVVRKPKDFYKGTIIGLLLSLFQILLLFFIYATFFDYKSIEKTPFPFHDIALYISVGSFFTNIETFFMAFWLIATYLRFMLLLYLNTWVFGAIFNIEKFELLVLPMGFLTLVVGLIPNNTVVTELVYRNQILDIVTIITLTFPLILLIGHFLKRRKGR